MAQSFDPARIKAMTRPHGMPFRIAKIGHVVMHCRDIERTVRFYTEVLGFKVSDVYPDAMVPGGMVFMRCSSDHHGVGFVGTMPGPSQNIELNHLAFEVATLDEVLRARKHLKAHGVAIDFEGRRRAGSQIAVEFHDPDGHRLEIFWGLDTVGSDDRIRPEAEWKWAHSARGRDRRSGQGPGHDPGRSARCAKERSVEEKRRAASSATRTQPRRREARPEGLIAGRAVRSCTHFALDLIRSMCYKKSIIGNAPGGLGPAGFFVAGEGERWRRRRSRWPSASPVTRTARGCSKG